MRLRNWVSGFACLLLMTVAERAAASTPFGVWTKVSKVVVEEADGGPARVQIHGVFSLFASADAGTFADRYTKPASGVMYFECPAGKAAQCKLEWADLTKNVKADLHTCVGFGQDTVPTGTLYPSVVSIGAPDVYPIVMGVGGGFTMCEVIAEFIGEGDAGSGGAGSGGAGSAGASGAAGSTSTGGAAGASADAATGAAGTGTGGAGASGGGSGGTTASGGSSGAPSTGGSGGTKPVDNPGDDGCALSRNRATSWGAAGMLAAGALIGLARARRRRS